MGDFELVDFSRDHRLQTIIPSRRIHAKTSFSTLYVRHCRFFQTLNPLESSYDRISQLLRVCPRVAASTLSLVLAHHVQEETKCEGHSTIRLSSLTAIQIKPLSPLRSSDRRRIADQIIAQFNVQVPPKEEEGKSENGPENTALGIGAIRNSLLPDNSLSARFTTTVGKDLRQVTGTLYVGSHPNEEQRVLWIKLDDRLLPTGVLL